jgi:Bacterial extracellular solute-binding proteins, family 3.
MRTATTQRPRLFPLREAALCLGLWLAATAPAGAEGTVKVGCVDFPPITFTNAAGAADGSAIALLGAILDQAGLAWEADRCVPGARLMANLRDGSTHVAMLIHHPDIAQSVIYGQLPMAHLDLDGYRLARTPPLGGIEALRGKRAILLRGYGYGGWIDFFKDPANAIAISYADSHQAALRMLVSGHGDYLVDYREPARQALAGTALPQVRREALARLETYFLVSRKAPGAEALLRTIEDGFRRLGAKPIN